jgi:hypothetical protein
MKNWQIYTQIDKINFGKYKGHTLDEIARIEAPYILWCIRNIPEFLVDINLLIELGSKYADDMVNVDKNGKEIDTWKNAHNGFIINKTDEEILLNKWKAYQEFLSNQRENEDCSDDHDYNDFLRDGFFEGDNDTYNEFMGY